MSNTQTTETGNTVEQTVTTPVVPTEPVVVGETTNTDQPNETTTKIEGNENGDSQQVAGELSQETPVTPPVDVRVDAPAVVEEVVVVALEEEEEVKPIIKPVAAKPVLKGIEGQLMDRLVRYSTNMAPRKPVTDAQVAQNQVALYRTIQETINTEAIDFKLAFENLMSWFEENKKGCCHETRVFRGFENIELSVNDRKGFMNLLNLLKVLSNPQTRRLGLKQVNLDTSLQFGVTQQGRNRVLAYFGK